MHYVYINYKRVFLWTRVGNPFTVVTCTVECGIFGYQFAIITTYTFYGNQISGRFKNVKFVFTFLATQDRLVCLLAVKIPSDMLFILFWNSLHVEGSFQSNKHFVKNTVEAKKINGPLLIFLLIQELVVHRKPCICDNFWCVKFKVLHFYVKTRSKASWIVKQK